MCGRFVQFSPASLLAEIYNISEVTGSAQIFKPSYNITPSSSAMVVVNERQTYKLDCFKWGFLPKWAVKLNSVKPMINAVSETAFEKKFFATAVKNTRCVVFMDGYYEWSKDVTSKIKIPYYFRRKDKLPIAAAGIYEKTEVSDTLMPQHSFAILTCKANEGLSGIHSRMPVILREEHIDKWLTNGELNNYDYDQLVSPIDPGVLDFYKVSTLVNSPANNNEQLIVPV